MIEWKFVCNAPKCAGIYSLKSKTKTEIRSSAQLRKELKDLYTKIDPNEYDIEILETLKDVFGEKAILKLEDHRRKYETGEVFEQPKTKIETNPNWVQAKKDGHIIVSIDKEHLEDLIKNTLKDNIDTYIITKYYE